jgi:hypothetical protein
MTKIQIFTRLWNSNQIYEKDCYNINPKWNHYQIVYINHMMDFLNVISPNVTEHKECGNELWILIVVN